MSSLVQSIVIVLMTILIVKRMSSVTHPLLKKILDWLPPILFAYIIPAATTHLLGIDLSREVIHNWSTEIIMPMAILTVMSALSFKQMRFIGWRPIAVFIGGSITIAAVPVVIVYVSKLFFPGLYQTLIIEGYWKGLITMVGSWIGGSTSQLVLKELTECSEELFVTILVMDNILVNLWTILMFQFIQSSDRWNTYFNIKDKVKDFVPDKIEIEKGSALTIAAILGILVLSYFFISSFLFKIILLSIVGLVLGNFISSWNHSLVLRMGGTLIIMIMAILGLKLKFENFGLPISMVVLSILWLLSHYIIMIFIAIKLKLHMAWLPIASMANVGGISTAPAVTAAYNEEWMPHAIILAILSMVTGTTWGMISIFIVKAIIGG